MSNGEEIFQDGEEYYRQVARNLQYAGKEIQFNQREYLLRGAQIEEIKHNFVRALEYYQCFLTCSKNKDELTLLLKFDRLI